MHSSIARYSPSGAFSPRTFVYVPGALLGAGVLAGVYAWLVDVIPFVYLNLLLALSLGGLVGMMTAMAIKAGHCRNRALGVVLGLLVGGAGLAASYAWSYLNSLRQASSKLGVPFDIVVM